jgi:hypothetical protein
MYYSNEKACIRMREKREERKAILVEYKGGICVDCKRVYPLCVFEFDHLGEKTFEIGQKILRLSIEELKEEADKCDLVCANCHRIRTKQRVYKYR